MGLEPEPVAGEGGVLAGPVAAGRVVVVVVVAAAAAAVVGSSTPQRPPVIWICRGRGPLPRLQTFRPAVTRRG